MGARSLANGLNGLENCSSSSPPAKKQRTADFSSLLTRSRSITEKTMDMDDGPKAKVINDSIHGHIRLPAAAVAIVDTEQFQRLRHLKQVGSCHFVYPAATHTRFQHSLGVAHLAFKFAHTLQKQCPDLIDDKDCLCVMLAGLCHDLGHGPYSHLWERFVSEADPGSNWHHEHNSIKMFDHLLDSNNLRPVLKKLAGIDDNDILFVKEQIAGPIDPETGLPANIPPGNKSWNYRGRDEEKSFLYEIVANKISGIDVDKWDYLIRDDYHLKIGHIFDYERFINYSKVIRTGNPLRRTICIRDKEAELILEMFSDRARLHKHGYQHRVVKAIARMLTDAFLLADKHIKVRGTGGKEFTLSKACQDIIAYEKLTDELFLRIKDTDSDEPDMIKASNLIKRIMRRDFYKIIATINLAAEHELRKKSASEIEVEIRGLVSGTQLDAENIVVVKSRVNMGMGSQNPIYNVTFYNKNEEVVERVDSLNINSCLPDFLNFETLLIFCKQNHQIKPAVQVLAPWIEQNGLQNACVQ